MHDEQWRGGFLPFFQYVQLMASFQSDVHVLHVPTAGVCSDAICCWLMCQCIEANAKWSRCYGEWQQHDIV